jgi:hypothetical protein
MWKFLAEAGLLEENDHAGRKILTNVMTRQMYLLYTKVMIIIIPIPDSIFQSFLQLVKDKVKNTLFSLGMVTYSYECQDIIQFALKDYREGDSAVNKLCKLLPNLIQFIIKHRFDWEYLIVRTCHACCPYLNSTAEGRSRGSGGCQARCVRVLSIVSRSVHTTYYVVNMDGLLFLPAPRCRPTNETFPNCMKLICMYVCII